MRGIASAAAFALAAIVLGIASLQRNVAPNEPKYTLHVENLSDPDGAVQRFSEALQAATVCSPDSPNHVGGDSQSFFDTLRKSLEHNYASIFKTLTLESINTYSLLFTWPGSEASLRPILFMSHLDVVPARHPESWTHPPFSGAVADGYIWGRGTLDTKGTLIAILEAVKQLVDDGFTPARTVILAFGHDEEVGGEFGAKAIAEQLRKRGTQVEFVLDEGGLVLTDGIRAGSWSVVDGPVALVGTAEKGIMNWEIEVQGVGGHSSVPPTGEGTSVAARLSRVLAKLESDLTSTRMGPPTTDFLKGLGMHTRYGILRALLGLADNGLVNPALAQLMDFAGRELSAMVRTTVAIVGVHAGGGASNVLPQKGTIELNMRTLPGDGKETIEKYLKFATKKEGAEFVGAAPRANTAMYPASAVTPASGPTWDAVARAIQETLSEREAATSIPVVPYLVTGMTDSRWYADLAPGKVFRFSPFRVNKTAGDLNRIHGVDERVGVEDWLDGVRFFLRFMKIAAGD